MQEWSLLWLGESPSVLLLGRPPPPVLPLAGEEQQDPDPRLKALLAPLRSSSGRAGRPAAGLAGSAIAAKPSSNARDDQRLEIASSCLAGARPTPMSRRAAPGRSQIQVRSGQASPAPRAPGGWPSGRGARPSANRGDEVRVVQWQRGETPPWPRPGPRRRPVSFFFPRPSSVRCPPRLSVLFVVSIWRGERAVREEVRCAVLRSVRCRAGVLRR